MGLALTAGAGVWTARSLRAPWDRPPSAQVDLVPLWCTARQLRGEAWRCTPEVLETVFKRRVPPRPTDDHTYVYPPTTAVLFLPTTGLPWDGLAEAFKLLSIAAVAICGLAPALARPTRAWPVAVGAGAMIAASFYSTRVVSGCLVAGQTGPLLAGLTALALGALGRGWMGLAGALAALGAALKVLPGVLLLAAGRHRRFVATCLGGLGMVATAALVTHGGPGGFPSYAHLGKLVNPTPHEAWLHNERPWVLALWQVRGWALGVPSLALAAWNLARPRGAAADATLGALLVAWLGTVMAGSQQAHEAAALFPAVAWVLAWPLARGPTRLPVLASAGLALALWRLGVSSRYTPPHSLNWLVVGYLAWALLLVRWLVERHAAAPPPGAPLEARVKRPGTAATAPGPTPPPPAPPAPTTPRSPAPPSPRRAGCRPSPPSPWLLPGSR